MFKKIVVLILVHNLTFAVAPVTDAMSYSYLIESINQTTQLIENANKQIETLGGIKTATDNLKRDIYNAKDGLTGAMDRLQGALQKSKETINNVSIKKLFSFKRKDIGHGSGGLAQKDIEKVLSQWIGSADSAITGGKSKKDVKSDFEKISRLNAALKEKSLKDFQRVLDGESGARTDYNNNIKLQKFVDKNIKNTKDAMVADIYKMTMDSFNKYYFAKDGQKSAYEDDEERLAELKEAIGQQKDLYRKVHLTNMLLFEMLQLSFRQYRHTINYRNAVVMNGYNNKNNTSFMKQIKKINSINSMSEKELKKYVNRNDTSKVSTPIKPKNKWFTQPSNFSLFDKAKF